MRAQEIGGLFELTDATLFEPNHTPGPPQPVGGLWTPINKLELLAPWIGLASLITAAAVSVGYLKRRKKKPT